MYYKALSYFEDLLDNRHAYQTGDVFPRKGMVVSDARLAELSSTKNRRGKPVIVRVDDKAEAQIEKPAIVEPVTVAEDAEKSEKIEKKEAPKKRGRKPKNK